MGNWGNCGLTEQMGQHHQDDMEGAIANLKVTLLDHLTGNFREERLLQLDHQVGDLWADGTKHKKPAAQ